MKRMKTNTQGGLHATGRSDCEVSTPLGHRRIKTLESLKHEWLGEALVFATDADLIRRLERAADEAASLAWATAYPLLALPELLAEKGREARRQFERQRAIQSRGGRTLRLAA